MSRQTGGRLYSHLLESNRRFLSLNFFLRDATSLANPTSPTLSQRPAKRGQVSCQLWLFSLCLCGCFLQSTPHTPSSSTLSKNLQGSTSGGQ